MPAKRVLQQDGRSAVVVVLPTPPSRLTTAIRTFVSHVANADACPRGRADTMVAHAMTIRISGALLTDVVLIWRAHRFSRSIGSVDRRGTSGKTGAGGRGASQSNVLTCFP